jgi:predicted nucleotidyltransferase
MQYLEEVAVIPARDKDILREVRQAIQRVLPGATVYLYGSGARGTREPDSDLDLLILTDARVSRDEETAVAEAIYELELTRGVVISTVQYERAEWEAPLMRATPFWNRVDAEAVRLRNRRRRG